MPSTYEEKLRLELQATGENRNTWGEKNNDNLERLADAIAGYDTVSIAGSGDYTLTQSDAKDTPARKSFLEFTGLLTGNRRVLLPAYPKSYFFLNSTTGSYTLTLKVGSSAELTLPAGSVVQVATDGTTLYFTSEIDRVARAGDTMTGALYLPTTATTTATQALRKDQIITLISTYLPAGIIMLWSGAIASIPSGWALCNGSNGTPDLRDRFVIGAGSTYSVGGTGGTSTMIYQTQVGGEHSHGGLTGATTLTISQIPAHDHGGVVGINGDHQHGLTGEGVWRHGDGAGANVVGPGPGGAQYYRGGGLTDTAGAHSHTISSQGGGTAHDHTISQTSTGHTHLVTAVPPYYALAYIMKLAY